MIQKNQSGDGGGDTHWGNLNRWMSLIRLLGREPLTLPQMAERSGIPYSTVCRLVRHQLVPLGVLEVVDKRYYPSEHRRPYLQRVFSLTHKGKCLAESMRHFNSDGMAR